MTPADFQRIKHAQNELISICGGLDAVKVITNYGRSTVGRWSDVGDPAIMPLPVVLTLQKHCHIPVITAAMAAIDNRSLADPDDASGGEQPVMTAVADAFVRSGEFTSTFATAMADGKLTPNELTDIDRALGRLERSVSNGRKSVAAARAAGGLKVVG